MSIFIIVLANSSYLPVWLFVKGRTDWWRKCLTNMTTQAAYGYTYAIWYYWLAQIYLIKTTVIRRWKSKHPFPFEIPVRKQHTISAFKADLNKTIIYISSTKNTERQCGGYVFLQIFMCDRDLFRQCLFTYLKLKSTCDLS